MNIIELVKTILTEYPKMTTFTNKLHVDFTDAEPTNFGLSSSGDAIISEDVLGNQIRQHNFVLYAINQAYTDYDRLTNSTFLLDLNYWLETQKGQNITKKENDIDVPIGKLLKLTSANGMLYSIPTGDINDGITYQIQIYAQYSIESEE